MAAQGSAVLKRTHKREDGMAPGPFLLHAPVLLPDFRNLGTITRVVLLAEAARFLAAYARSPDLPATIATFSLQVPLFDPVLLTVVVALFALSPRLGRLPYRLGVATVIALATTVMLAWQALYEALFPAVAFERMHQGVTVSVLLTAAILWYFNWRHRVLSPALSEARALALQSRIRPHFLFNSLNTVLGLMREEPRRAEAVLENLAELYRALLAETGTLVPLARELELARGYAEIEAMRLGSRLAFDWQCQGAPPDALVPPLIIQPLLENAVYHGVEPSEAGGTVSVTVFLKGEQLNLVVRNPCSSPSRRRSGNRMALTNIRERLALHFDAEAEMSAYVAGEEFVVQIRMPYRHG